MWTLRDLTKTSASCSIFFLQVFAQNCASNPATPNEHQPQELPLHCFQRHLCLCVVMLRHISMTPLRHCCGAVIQCKEGACNTSARGAEPETLLALEGIETFFLRARFRSQHSRLPSANLSLQLLHAQRMLSLQISKQMLLHTGCGVRVAGDGCTGWYIPTRGMQQCVKKAVLDAGETSPATRVIQA